MRGEKATAVEKLRLGMKSASAKSLVNGRSRATTVTCLDDDAVIRDTRKRAVGRESIEIKLMNGVGVGAKRRCPTKSSSCPV
jgi:hypothetical protein